jgi:hypothetical protein
MPSIKLDQLTLSKKDNHNTILSNEVGLVATTNNAINFVDSANKYHEIITNTSLRPITGNLQSQINNLNDIINSGNVGGSGHDWTPIAGNGISITAPTSSTYNFSVIDYIGASQVESISANLNSKVVENTNSLQTLFSTYTNSTTTANISAGLQSQIANLISRVDVLEQNSQPLAINTFDIVSPNVI